MRINLSKAVKQEINAIQAQKLEPVIKYQAPVDNTTRNAVLAFIAIVATVATLASCGVINVY